MPTRRSIIAAGLLLGGGQRAWAVEPLTVFSADVRPLSIAEGSRRGIVLDVVADAARTIGREVRFTFLPFAEAMQRTLATPGALMAPLARTPQREPNYAWIAKVLDVPQAMGTPAARPVADLAAAKGLGRIGVVKGGVQESFLKEQGLGNLVAFATAREIALALGSGELDAWYGTATEIALQFELIGKPGQVRLGPAIQSAPVWLAAHRDTASLPVAALAAAIAELDRSGAVGRHYRAYVPA